MRLVLLKYAGKSKTVNYAVSFNIYESIYSDWYDHHLARCVYIVIPVGGEQFLVWTRCRF